MATFHVSYSPTSTDEAEADITADSASIDPSTGFLNFVAAGLPVATFRTWNYYEKVVTP